jgi:hypothetical protein
VTDFRVVFSNEPLAYREAMASVIRSLRPAIDVSLSEPEDLDAAISRVQPHLVICNDLTDSMRSRLLAWVMLYPEGQSHVTCGIAGQERHLLGIDLAGLVSLVDEVVSQFLALSGLCP